jgi:hypothetical protein
MGHSWHADSRAESNAFIAKMLETAGRVPDHLRFVTYTTRFNKAFWLTVGGLDETYKRAEVDATRNRDGTEYTVTTKNISRLEIEASGGTFTIDAQTIKANANPSFEKMGSRWAVAGAPTGLQKTHGLQGPVDDAFMDAFLCVRPTGTAWNPVAQKWAGKTLEVFSLDFSKWLRGDVRVKDDRAVTASDIADHNLILFGDPGSNSVMAKIVERLPIGWSKTEIAVGTQKFAAADHIPVLVYPNPLNPKRYVVINSGHTFNQQDILASNAYLFPKLPDWAVLKLGGSKAELVAADFFDERWRLRREHTVSAAGMR